MPKKPLKKSKTTAKDSKKLKKTTKKEPVTKRAVSKASASKTKTKVTVKSTKAKTAKSTAKSASSTKTATKKVTAKKMLKKSEEVKEKRKAGRPPKSKVIESIETSPAEAPRKRGRPRKVVSEAALQEAAAAKAAGPKKRGRKSKAELAAIAQGLDPSTVVKSASDGSAAGSLPLGQAIKRKRGRPRKNEQYGAGGAVLNTELMARGIRRFGIPLGGSDVPVARYSWSAETGEHLNPKTANFSSADSGTEIFSNEDVEFSKSDKVVYPAHGLGVVQAIQSRMVSGAQQKFYMILIIETGMKIMVPVSQAKTVGLRRVVDHSTVDRVYAILKDKNVSIDNQTWNRRYREYSQKIKTGSVLEIASVIRDLTVLKVEKELSFNERRMLDTAQGLLVKELSIAKSSSEELIKEELDQICQF